MIPDAPLTGLGPVVQTPFFVSADTWVDWQRPGAVRGAVASASVAIDATTAPVNSTKGGVHTMSHALPPVDGVVRVFSLNGKRENNWPKPSHGAVDAVAVFPPLEHGMRIIARAA